MHSVSLGRASTTSHFKPNASDGSHIRHSVSFAARATWLSVSAPHALRCTHCACSEWGGASFLNPTVSAGVAFGSGGTQFRKGPAYTERALWCRVTANGQVELVNSSGLSVRSRATAHAAARQKPSQAQTQTPETDSPEIEDLVQLLDTYLHAQQNGQQNGLSLSHCHVHAPLCSPDADGSLGQKSTSSEINANAAPDSVSQKDEALGPNGLMASDALRYRQHVCEIDDHVARYNADTRGPEYNRSEGKVLLLVSLHDTFPIPDKTETLWLACDSLAAAHRLKTEVFDAYPLLHSMQLFSAAVSRDLSPRVGLGPRRTVESQTTHRTTAITVHGHAPRPRAVCPESVLSRRLATCCASIGRSVWTSHVGARGRVCSWRISAGFTPV